VSDCSSCSDIDGAVDATGSSRYPSSDTFSGFSFLGSSVVDVLLITGEGVDFVEGGGNQNGSTGNDVDVLVGAAIGGAGGALVEEVSQNL